MTQVESGDYRRGISFYGEQPPRRPQAITPPPSDQKRFIPDNDDSEKGLSRGRDGDVWDGDGVMQTGSPEGRGSTLVYIRRATQYVMHIAALSRA